MSRVLELPTTTYAENTRNFQALANNSQDMWPRPSSLSVELSEEKAVLVCYQPSRAAHTQLRHRLNRELEFHVTSETGFHAGLEHLYGKPPRPRWPRSEELEAKVQENQSREGPQELGLNEKKGQLRRRASETRTIAFVIGERGDELAISAMSTQSGKVQR